ncbi:MAG: AAC(3) family N-acetyltransferase [Candidatus Bathyarchaeota archaeon]|nr:AAC(3) family N-acetyltransferase [Candidatus Bathyarchaeota archaeon]
MREEIPKGQIIDDLRDMGVEAGDHLAVALSFKSIGRVRGGPNALIDALLETVGPNGTVMMNAYTQSFPLSETPNHYVFDPKVTPTYTGLIPETLRKRANSVRSRHPTTSVTAMGKISKYLVEDHDEQANPFLPFSKLALAGGKYLAIGIGDNLVAIRHEAQRRAGFFTVVPMFHGVNYKSANGEIQTFVWRKPPCTRRLTDLVPPLITQGIAKIGRIGKAYAVLGSAKGLVDAMTEMLKKDPTLNLCDDVLCLWCREFERRMDLYSKISKPHSFQKSRLVTGALVVINWFRLRKYNSPLLSLQKKR